MESVSVPLSTKRKSPADERLCSGLSNNREQPWRDNPDGSERTAAMWEISAIIVCFVLKERDSLLAPMRSGMRRGHLCVLPRYLTPDPSGRSQPGASVIEESCVYFTTLERASLCLRSLALSRSQKPSFFDSRRAGCIPFKRAFELHTPSITRRAQQEFAAPFPLPC